MGELIQDYLPTHSIGFKIVERTHPNLINVRIEWENEFQYVIEPEDPEIRKYFSGKWLNSWGSEFFPPKTLWQEFRDASAAMMDISKSVFRSKLLRK